MFKQFSQPSAAMVDQQAGRITDPLERLRYLRKHALIPVTAPPPDLHTAPSNAHRARLQTLAILAITLTGAATATYFWPTTQTQAATPPIVIPPSGPAPDRIWNVENSEAEEVYSNGLRIDLTFATHNRPRAEYPVYALGGTAATTGQGQTPRGIVFHTTESDMVPFEEAESRRISNLGTLLLRYIRREKSYHYLIDRYARVYRVVEESDAANHAGYSVWSDAQGVYVNLNDSFIGVAFEGKTGQRSDITAAQISAARQLTELLRERYQIAPENCVTHAQVSVNPYNMRIGNHLDWAQGFPWAAFNLPDNYRIPLPAVTEFGFEHDESLTSASGGTDWPGLTTADRTLLSDALTLGATEQRFRGMLRHRYKEILADLKRQHELRDEAARSKGAPAAATPASDLGDI